MITNPFRLHVNNLESSLTEELKIYAAVISLPEKYFDLENASLLKLARSFVFKVRKELKTAKFNVATVPNNKRQCQAYDTLKTLEFVIHISMKISQNR